MSMRIRLFLILAALPLFCQASAPVENIVYRDADIHVQHYPARGDHLVLWLAPSYGFRPGHQLMARMLAEQGIEVWQLDLIEALFLPYSSSSARKLDGDYVAEVISRACRTSGKKVTLLSNSYGTIPLLKGIHHWQLRNTGTNCLGGAILFTPNAYQTIPPLGSTPEYMPVVSATNYPLMIYQGEKNGNRWQLELLVEELNAAGSQVFYELLPGINGLFYEAEVSAMQKNTMRYLAKQFPGQLSFLHSLPKPSRAGKILVKDRTQQGSGVDTQLRPYHGKVKPLPIRLHDAKGKLFSLDNYTGKVRLVNFWATWCPPCIEEIPSLNRLKQKMQGKSFELISINYAEDKKTIEDFLKKVDVDFTVLMDINGEYARQWKVLAYPSTFVIGADGKIYYGVNAAIEWDSPQVIRKLQALMK